MTEAPSSTEKAGAGSVETPPERLRFEVELEFVQCLASPTYLNFLAQNEYFDSPDFVAYLKYLLYWRKPEYAKFIVFPHALYFLHLLQEPPFREALKRSDYSMMLHQQQGYHWQFEKTMRLRSETVNESNGGEKGEGEGQRIERAEGGANESPGTMAADGNMTKPNVADPRIGAST